MFDTALTASDFVFLAKGAGITIIVTAISVVIGTLLGIIFGVIRVQAGAVLAAPLTFFLDIFRSIPLLIQLVLANAFCGMVLQLRLSGFTVACIVLSLYTAAYCAEIVRGWHRCGPDDDAPRGTFARHDMGTGHAPHRAASGNPRGPAVLDRSGPWRHERFGSGLRRPGHRVAQIDANPHHAPARADAPASDLWRILLHHQLPAGPVRRLSRKKVVQ